AFDAVHRAACRHPRRAAGRVRGSAARGIRRRVAGRVELTDKEDRKGRPSAAPPDVVYIVGPGRREWLRWSLRSLRNLRHRHVWVVGMRPSWVRNVGYIAVDQAGTKYHNSTANVLAACDHEDRKSTRLNSSHVKNSY